MVEKYKQNINNVILKICLELPGTKIENIVFMRRSNIPLKQTILSAWGWDGGVVRWIIEVCLFTINETNYSIYKVFIRASCTGSNNTSTGFYCMSSNLRYPAPAIPYMPYLLRWSYSLSSTRAGTFNKGGRYGIMGLHNAFSKALYNRGSFSGWKSSWTRPGYPVSKFWSVP